MLNYIAESGKMLCDIRKKLQKPHIFARIGVVYMTKILFVCHGNICRSPMAEFALKDMVKKAGIESRFEIASAGTSSEELGNPVYPPARRKLAEHGIDCDGKFARRITAEDYDNFDLLIGMDDEDMYRMNRLFSGDPQGKLHLLLDFAGRPGEYVSDPWYTRDFETAWLDIESGCRGLLDTLSSSDTLTLDFSACESVHDMYRILSRSMDWQDWYGENLDALWDILTGLPHKGEHFSFILPDENASAELRSYAERIKAVFDEAEEFKKDK